MSENDSVRVGAIVMDCQHEYVSSRDGPKLIDSLQFTMLLLTLGSSSKTTTQSMLQFS